MMNIFIKLLNGLVSAAAALVMCVAASGANVGAGPSSWTGDLSPIGASDWNYDRAAHLMERAGFGATPEEIRALAAMTPADAVRQLVFYQKVQDVDLAAFHETGIYPSRDFDHSGSVAAFAPILFGTLDKMPEAARTRLMDDARTGVTPEDKRIAKTGKQAVVDKFYYWNAVDALEAARADSWLADRMLRTKRPLQEKLVLFWHGHFASGNEKVHDYRKMLAQFAMLRENANGNLRNLLIGIGQDPAMLIYLDNRQNLKGHPNENFAREVMELFSLGVGNYTENDIKEAARAFTGWTLDATSTKFVNRTELHDDGVKTLLGRTGNFRGEDVVDILLAQPACSRFISRKLYRFLVREDLPKDLQEKLSARLVETKYEIAPFLETVFLSKDFYSQASYATQIKSPIQMVMSIYRKLGLTELPTYPAFPSMTAGLGQALFYPPNVKGWDGGKSWINPATMFDRENMARYILFPEEMPVKKDAYLEGPRRLAGDVIHNEFLSMAERGNYTDFPSNGVAGKMATMSPGTTVMSSAVVTTTAPVSTAGAPVTRTPAPELAAAKAVTNSPGADPVMKGSAGSETMKLSGEDFNLFRGVFNASVFAIRAVPPGPRKPARFELVKMVRRENIKDAAGVVDSFTGRFLRVPLPAESRAALIAFCEKQIGGSALDYKRYSLEKDLREVLHLVLSIPESQLS